MKHYITIIKTYHNESTALERSVMNYLGAGGGGGGGGGGGELKLTSIVVKTSICSVRVKDWRA